MWDRLSTPVAVGLGIALSVANILSLAVLPRSTAIGWYAAELAIVYAVYVVFAFQGESHTGRRTESAFAAAGVGLSAVGSQYGAWLIVGWLAHGVWDFLHHADRKPVIGTRDVPAWYIPLCVGYDVLAAAGVLILVW